MTKTAATVDYEGSYLLGEADGEMWANHAHPNETQAMSMLQAEEIGQRDVFGQENASWLREQSDTYQQQDPHFDAAAYFEGFLASARRVRQAFVFAAAGARRGR